MQLGELEPHLHAQHGVEVRKRLIEIGKALGSRTRARPMATRCRWPPESCAGLTVQKRLRAEACVRPLRRAGILERRAKRLAIDNENAIFSRTVI